MAIDILFYVVCVLVGLAAIVCIRWVFLDMDDIFIGMGESRRRHDKTDIRLDKIESALNIQRDETTNDKG
jgi:hypothetical protein